MGARLKTREFVPVTWERSPDYAVDIQRDQRGEFFELRWPEALRGRLDFTVMQTEPRERHLLLLARKSGGEPPADRFLCGYDEREWFVAAVPGGASSVRQAMDALRPPVVRQELARRHVSWRKRYERKNRAFRRQGEWFFVPAPSLVVDAKFMLHQEPLRRGAGKPHWVEELVRMGGETVHVCQAHPNGLTESHYREVLQANPVARSWNWRVMRRNPEVYARGTVRHHDHDTITLPDWHRVVMNTETETRTMQNVAFLD